MLFLVVTCCSVLYCFPVLYEPTLWSSTSLVFYDISHAGGYQYLRPPAQVTCIGLSQTDCAVVRTAGNSFLCASVRISRSLIWKGLPVILSVPVILVFVPLCPSISVRKDLYPTFERILSHTKVYYLVSRTVVGFSCCGHPQHCCLFSCQTVKHSNLSPIIHSLPLL